MISARWVKAWGKLPSCQSRRDPEVAALLGVQQGREHARRIEPRTTEEVHCSIGGHQGGGLEVADKTVITNVRVTVHNNLLTLAPPTVTLPVWTRHHPIGAISRCLAAGKVTMAREAWGSDDDRRSMPEPRLARAAAVRRAADRRGRRDHRRRGPPPGGSRTSRQPPRRSPCRSSPPCPAARPARTPAAHGSPHYARTAAWHEARAARRPDQAPGSQTMTPAARRTTGTPGGGNPGHGQPPRRHRPRAARPYHGHGRHRPGSLLAIGAKRGEKGSLHAQDDGQHPGPSAAPGGQHRLVRGHAPESWPSSLSAPGGRRWVRTTGFSLVRRALYR